MGKALLLAVVTFVLTAPLVATLLFFPVMLLAGPHSAMLPALLQTVVVLLAWLAVVAIPGWLARRVFRRFDTSRRTARPAA